jgi:NO-binding membrane sensor protein with MHYT domain
VSGARANAGTISRRRRFRLPLGQAWRQAKMGASVLIGILITFLVVILVLYLVQRLPLDGRTRQIAQIVIIIIGIISLLKYLAVF